MSILGLTMDYGAAPRRPCCVRVLVWCLVFGASQSAGGKPCVMRAGGGDRLALVFSVWPWRHSPAGPFGFMDNYEPHYTPNSSDGSRRYSFHAQAAARPRSPSLTRRRLCGENAEPTSL